MALSKAQRALIAKAVGRDNGGGEAYRQWQDDPGANWVPPSNGLDGARSSVGPSAQSFPLPNANKKNKYWRGKPKPIPSTKTTHNDWRGRNT